jgi:hypothetical protein
VSAGFFVPAGFFAAAFAGFSGCFAVVALAAFFVLSAIILSPTIRQMRSIAGMQRT